MVVFLLDFIAFWELLAFALAYRHENQALKMVGLAKFSRVYRSRTCMTGYLSGLVVIAVISGRVMRSCGQRRERVQRDTCI
jgi:hypothetical protein